MILALMNGGGYRQCLAASLLDSSGYDHCPVGKREDVLRFLRNHPDQEFILVTQGYSGSTIAQPDLADAAVCGTVEWNSQAGSLINEPIPVGY
jgi:hypothetical protein